MSLPMAIMYNTFNAALMAGSKWSVGNFLQNSSKTLQKWGGYFVILMGVVMMIVGVYKVVKGLTSERAQVSWFKVLLLILVGGAFSVGGWNFVKMVSSGGHDSIKELGEGSGTIMPTIGIERVIER